MVNEFFNAFYERNALSAGFNIAYTTGRTSTEWRLLLLRCFGDARPLPTERIIVRKVAVFELGAEPKVHERESPRRLVAVVGRRGGDDGDGQAGVGEGDGRSRGTWEVNVE